jgi:hypothetical protein
MGKEVGGNSPPHFEKLRVAKPILSPTPLFGIKFERKSFFTLVWKHILSS